MIRNTLAPLLLAVSLLLGCSSSVTPAARKSDAYLYQDTRQLVQFVESAAALIEQRGTGAFQEFGRERSQWQTFGSYLFVYDSEGTAVWHGMNPELVGRNLASLRDMLGKPVVQELLQIGKRPERDAAGWTFYLWEEQTDLLPGWKSSYVRKAVAPDGKVYLVGSGSGRIKIEKVFVRDRVDAAAALLQEQGEAAAVRQLKDVAGRFYFLGTFVFVLDGSGHALVDPAYPTLEGRDMSRFGDAIGRQVVKEVLQKLEHSDTAWVQFLWHKPGDRMPARKLMYVHKVNVDGRTLLVGSHFFLASPIWMRF